MHMCFYLNKLLMGYFDMEVASDWLNNISQLLEYDALAKQQHSYVHVQ